MRSGICARRRIVRKSTDSLRGLLGDERSFMLLLQMGGMMMMMMRIMSREGMGRFEMGLTERGRVGGGVVVAIWQSRGSWVGMVVMMGER